MFHNIKQYSKSVRIVRQPFFIEINTRELDNTNKCFCAVSKNVHAFYFWITQSKFRKFYRVKLLLFVWDKNENPIILH